MVNPILIKHLRHFITINHSQSRKGAIKPKPQRSQHSGGQDKRYAMEQFAAEPVGGEEEVHCQRYHKRCAKRYKTGIEQQSPDTRGEKVYAKVPTLTY